MFWSLLACQSRGSVFMSRTWGWADAGTLHSTCGHLPSLRGSIASSEVSVSPLRGAASHLALWVSPEAELEAKWLWNLQSLSEQMSLQSKLGTLACDNSVRQVCAWPV